jgi:probable HAF family extracellular repeat protein
MRISLCAGLIATVLASSASAGTYLDIGLDGAQLTSLSVNGRIAGGVIGNGAWRWAKDQNATIMPGFVTAAGMNSWAQPIAGQYTPDSDMGDSVAALYYSNSTLLGGPDLVGGYPGTGGGFGQGVSSAYGISDTGVVVGLAYDATNNPIAFRWTAAEGMTRLAVNRSATYSRANAISRDGSTIVGWNDQADGFRSGVIWRDGVPLDLVDANGIPVGEALGVSADGRVVVGINDNTANGQEAWRWTEQTGVEPLGVIAGMSARSTKVPAAVRAAQQRQHNLPSEQRDVRLASPDGFFPPASLAIAVSDDGSTIVGGSGIPPSRSAVIWTEQGGMQLLADYAAARGVTIPAGYFLASANAVSGDGLSIGGFAVGPTNYESFVIDLHHARPIPAKLTASGVVGYNDLPSGPFAGVPEGTPVQMSFVISPDGFEISPGQNTAYPIVLSSFKLAAGTAHDTLQNVDDGVYVSITNDYPKSDGIHLFSTPTASGQAFEFELFNPGGDMFDSDDLARINRTFGPEFFEKISWIVSEGDSMMWIDLQSVHIADYKPRISPLQK